MIRSLFQDGALIDTSAAIALFNPDDQFHKDATAFFTGAQLVWFTVNTTAHELFTRVRYDQGLFPALKHYDFLRSSQFNLITFNQNDEQEARILLERYNDQDFSFHDVLLRTVMLRNKIYKIFTFDRHFWTLQLEVIPGPTA